jgi:phage gp46-like protein
MSTYCDIKIDFNIYGDIAIEDGDISLDVTLKTAVIISLFSDARTPESIEFSEDRRGYWGDSIDEEKIEMGSLLWMQDRSRLNQQTIDDRKNFCTNAMQWLITDGIADNIVVNAERSIINRDAIITNIVIYKSNKNIGSISF